ncbi:MAG: MGMT family protein [Prochlorothrix sp.]|nr:MGMT family protein [Prochlorothrix sp.]
MTAINETPIEATSTYATSTYATSTDKKSTYVTSTDKKSTDKKSTDKKSTYDRIYAVVRQIPPGQVASYGQIATLAGLPGRARLVGYALFRVTLPSTDIPWHRVINAKGEVSHSPQRRGTDYIQAQMLADEGIEFDPKGRISWQRYGWQPEQRRGG